MFFSKEIVDERELILKVEGKYRPILKALLHARRTYPAVTWKNFPEWFRANQLPQAMRRYECLLNALEGRLAQFHGQLAGEFETKKLDYEPRKSDWQSRLGEASRAYQQSLAGATQYQWSLGPQFLMALEDRCRTRSIPCASIPWDPARMVGWKLRVRLPDLTPQALAMTTRVPQSQPSAVNGFDGGLFADHIYYLAMVDERHNRISPRQAALKVMTELSGPINLLYLSNIEGLKSESIQESSKLADSILTRWGWKPEQRKAIGPLGNL